MTGFRALRSIEPFPTDLRMIAGDAKGQSQAKIGGESAINFVCQGGTLVRGSWSKAPTCSKPLIDLVIKFPDCWNGVNSDSKDHKSHMAYSRRNGQKAVCPSTHPRLVPAVRMTVRYKTNGGPGMRLASGAVNTAHADFMNGWDDKKMKTMVDLCLKRDKYFGGGSTPVPGHQKESATGPGV
jgi:hypothetical protein